MTYPVILRNSSLMEEVDDELSRAMELHKPQNSFHEGYAVLLEEVDEFWEQVKVNPKKLTPEQQAVRLAEIRKELIQIAAMALRTIKDVVEKKGTEDVAR